MPANRHHHTGRRKKQLILAVLVFTLLLAAACIAGRLLDAQDERGDGGDGNSGTSEEATVITGGTAGAIEVDGTDNSATAEDTAVAIGDTAETIEVDGVTYRRRSRQTSILLMGVDKESSGSDESYYYRTGGQVDFMTLLVVDDARKTVYKLEIDRDTMAEMTTVSTLGRENGTRVAQICLAHAYGNTQLYSNSLQNRAVSNYLLGTAIDYSFSMTLDGIPILNDWFGGVTVTLEDDFSAEDPAWMTGSTVTLHGADAERFVRSRMSVGDGKNTSRMRRQRTYLNAVTELAQARFAASRNSVGELYDALSDYITTGMSRARLINTVWAARDYTIVNMTIEGTHQYGEDGYMQFLPDEASVKNAVLQIFYDPAEQ